MKPSKAEFSETEWRIIQAHTSPQQAQKFLSSLPYNREREKPTCLSFRGVVRHHHAHCLEGAIAAAVILEQHGYPPLLISIESQDQLDHVLFVFRQRGLYGALARSRDIGLHGRKPVFRTARDLVMSYYDAYIDKSGRITGYAVADLRALGNYDWRLSEKNVWKVERYLQEIPHKQIRGSEARYQKSLRRYLAFHKEHPQQSPDYFANKNLWLL
ncbi:MAG: hypothetical protein HY231_07105 [Acidobacteria bacterium]|nr:hypothetical protein [Acidobacteriota bacterium]